MTRMQAILELLVAAEADVATYEDMVALAQGLAFEQGFLGRLPWKWAGLVARLGEAGAITVENLRSNHPQA